MASQAFGICSSVFRLASVEFAPERFQGQDGGDHGHGGLVAMGHDFSPGVDGYRVVDDAGDSGFFEVISKYWGKADVLGDDIIDDT